MYSATAIKGRIGFKIGSDVSTDEPDESLKVKIDDKAIARAEKAAQVVANKKVGKIVKPGEKDVRIANVPDKIALGRSKKK
jgi:hypothetical protein